MDAAACSKDNGDAVAASQRGGRQRDDDDDDVCDAERLPDASDITKNLSRRESVL